MATSPVPVRPQSISFELVERVLLCVAAVVTCYQFEWDWLRSATCYWNLIADNCFGVHLVRTSADTVMWRGQLYHYVVACTMADVWCGALAWLWNSRQTLAQNLARWFLFGLGLFVFNIARLTFSDVLFAANLPWDLAHNVVSGIAYWLIWRWLWNRRAFAIS